ncbi:MAG: SDR family NAD(P)-dependent oxidoreductase [Candidatus Nanopelagicales bacterium]|jgi:NAD(P)-dependent dehydrogenase (short-subunit alcohol dehydrogenase family)|nr:SDR family NAD(P)-dependent oxidoreductase [Candidatus Nanopelagicales bacterium]
MQVAGRVVVVTGAGSGMGRALALELLRRGAQVAAVDLRAEPLAETAALAAAGPRLSTHVLDITDQPAVAALPDAVIAAHGVVDAIVNNAGIIQPFVTIEDLDEAVMARVMDVNFWGTVHMVKAFLPHLRRRPEAHIANVSSMGGFLPVPGQVAYGASKAAVKLLTEGLYAELLDTGVGVSVIMPGAVATNITGNSGVAAPGGMDAAAAQAAAARTLSADAAARIMVDGIERDRLHIYVGRDSQLMGAAVRLAPKRATHLIQSKMKDLLGS